MRFKYFIETNMPFGKYAGKEIKDIPKDYLQWLIKNANNLKSEIKKEIEEVLSSTKDTSEESPVLSFGKFAGKSVLELQPDNDVINWARWALKTVPEKFNNIQKQKLEELSKVKLKRYSEKEREELMGKNYEDKVRNLRMKGLKLLDDTPSVMVPGQIFAPIEREFKQLFNYGFDSNNHWIIRLHSSPEEKLDGWQANEYPNKAVSLHKISYLKEERKQTILFANIEYKKLVEPIKNKQKEFAEKINYDASKLNNFILDVIYPEIDKIVEQIKEKYKEFNLTDNEITRGYE